MVSLRGPLPLPSREVTDHVQRLVHVVKALDLEEVGPVADGNNLVVAGLHRVAAAVVVQRAVQVAP